MRIRSASRADLLGLVALMTASPLLRRYAVTARRARANLAEALRSGDVVLVGVDGGTIVGFAWVIPTRALDHTAYLRLLLVAEGRQSRGAGATLLARAEGKARAAGCRHMALLVTATNQRARRFYERAGYRRVGDLSRFVRRGLTESLYVKSWNALS